MDQQNDGAICGLLRSKRYYFLKRAPRASEDLLDASNDCWCARTQMRLGPDGDPSHPDDCRPARRCHAPDGVRPVEA